MNRSPATRRSRHFGKRSPLDRLAPAIGGELWTRCLRGDTLRELQAWLKAEHGVKTSCDSLSRWNMRRDELLRAEAATKAIDARQMILAGPLEIKVTPLPRGRCGVELIKAASGPLQPGEGDAAGQTFAGPLAITVTPLPQGICRVETVPSESGTDELQPAPTPV